MRPRVVAAGVVWRVGVVLIDSCQVGAAGRHRVVETAFGGNDIRAVCPVLEDIPVIPGGIDVHAGSSRVFTARHIGRACLSRLNRSRQQIGRCLHIWVGRVDGVIAIRLRHSDHSKEPEEQNAE